MVGGFRRETLFGEEDEEEEQKRKGISNTIHPSTDRYVRLTLWYCTIMLPTLHCRCTVTRFFYSLMTVMP